MKALVSGIFEDLLKHGKTQIAQQVISNNISQWSKYAFCKVQKPSFCNLQSAHAACSSNAKNHTSDLTKENGKFHLSVLLDETIP